MLGDERMLNVKFNTFLKLGIKRILKGDGESLANGLFNMITSKAGSKK